MTAKLSFAADLTRHARHFRGERTELIDHRVDRVLQLQNLAANIDGDLFRQIAVRDRGRDLGNVSHLAGQVAGHRIHRVGEILPRAGHAADFRLASEPSFGAYFARHARDLVRERTELIDHRVDRVFQLQNLALHIDRDLLGKIAVRDRGRDFRDVADLTGQIAGHEIHAVREILPSAGDAAHIGLPAKFSFRADLARHARHFRRERAELIDHRVDRVLQLENFALHIDRDLLGEIAASPLPSSRPRCCAPDRSDYRPSNSQSPSDPSMSRRRRALPPDRRECLPNLPRAPRE